jgi:RNA polymerase sigma-70 factor (ECF subfamily)
VTSDKILVQAVIAGEKQAYQQLYDRYAPLARAVCYDTTGNLADAQDLAQDVFLRAYQKLGQLRDQNYFGKWIVGIARLRCKEYLRQRSKGLNKHVELRDDHASTGQACDEGQIEQLRAAIATLPAKERLALHVFYLQGRSAESAQKVMGLSRSGFYRVLERARKRLAAFLDDKREDI